MWHLNIAYCGACGYAHGKEHKTCRLLQIEHAKYGAPGQPAPERIPDNDLSVCTLHPGRKRMAHALLASVYPDGLDL